MTSPTPVTRRSVLLTAAKAAAFLALPSPRQEQTRILVATHGAGSAGAVLGVEEALHAWQLLGRALALDRIDVGVSDGPDLVASDALARSPIVVTTVEGGLRSGWREALASNGVLHIDGTATGAESHACRPLRFEVAPPRTDPSSMLWHPSLERYGARQLNDRFVSRFSTPMGSADWAGWFAVKVASEAALRVGFDPAALAEYLVSERAAFDGHKGRPLRFGPDHRLIQPVYLTHRGSDGGERVEEVLPTTDRPPACR